MTMIHKHIQYVMTLISVGIVSYSSGHFKKEVGYMYPVYCWAEFELLI